MAQKIKRIVNKKLRDSFKGRDCEACGRYQSANGHHLKYKSAGGDDVAENLIALCPECHTVGHWAIHRVLLETFIKHFPHLKLIMAGKGWEYCELLQRWIYPENLINQKYREAA